MRLLCLPIALGVTRPDLRSQGPDSARRYGQILVGSGFYGPGVLPDFPGQESDADNDSDVCDESKPLIGSIELHGALKEPHHVVSIDRGKLGIAEAAACQRLNRILQSQERKIGAKHDLFDTHKRFEGLHLNGIG